MNYIKVTPENLDKEHICCAISNNNDCQVASKKAWLASRFNDGLVFLKGDVRGKCFIEYLPADKAWAPIDAPNYMYIDCLWVAGQYKRLGCGGELLARCVADARESGMAGVCALSSVKKKKSFLSDPDFLAHEGFKTADTAEPYFALMYLPLAETSAAPRFRESVKRPAVPREGFALYYADQCPFTAKYVPILEAAAAAREIPLSAFHIDTVKLAQNAPSPFTSFSLFYNGEFLTHEILSEQKFLKLAQELRG